MAARYVCKCCGKEMFSLVEVVEDWNDIYCKACNPEAPPPRPQPSVYRHQQRTHRRARRRTGRTCRGAPCRSARPRWWEAAYGAEVPLMFLIRARRAAPHGADVPPLATPAWDVERALAALNVTEVPFDATYEQPARVRPRPNDRRLADQSATAPDALSRTGACAPRPHHRRRPATTAR